MNEKRTLLASMFNLLGGISGMLSLAMIIWNGGTLWQMVHDHGRRLDNIELGGSIGLREHVKEDNERVRDLQDRMKQQELQTTKVTELVGDVKLINFKLDTLKEQIAKPKVP